MAKPGLYRDASERVKHHLNQTIVHLGAARDCYIGLFDDPNLASVSDPLGAELQKYIEQLHDFDYKFREKSKSEKPPFITPGKGRSMIK